MRGLILFFLLAAPTAHAQSKALYNTSRATLYSGLAVDIATTERVMRLGGLEMNPIAGQNPYRRNGIAIGATVATDLLTRWLRKNGSPKLATAANFIISGLHFGASVHNARQSAR
jgi:hypothetical protein